MTIRDNEPIPPSQLFRTMLLRLLESQQTLSLLVRHTTSKELKLCHHQNVYFLSEIGSWLADQTEGTDLTPSFSPATAAELLGGVVSSLQTPRPASSATTAPAPTAPMDLPPGIRRAASSRRRVATAVPLERTSTGRIIFRQQSSSGKPPDTSPTPLPSAPELPSDESGPPENYP